MTTASHGLLAGWLTEQRWFAGKGHAIDDLSIDSLTEIRPGDPGLVHLIVSVRQADRRTRYQLLAGLRAELPERLKHVLIGTCQWADEGERYLYDAAHDAALTSDLPAGMADELRVGDLTFHHVPGTDIDTGQRSLVLTAEQSNTSLVYGDKYILKLFRQLTPGVNPELEIVTGLAAAGSVHVARPYGWIEAPVDGEPTTLAIMQEFLSNAGDGWTMALTSVRDLYASAEDVPAEEAGGDFAAESFRLGTATAEVHRQLAEAFPTGTIEPADIKQMTELFRRRLDRAVAEVPALGEHADVAGRAFDRLAELGHGVPVQRVHGDYHLGQVMRTPADWVVLDFEGEPGQPLAERRALDSPLRDVAGMLRSFDYAARHLLADHPEAESLEGRALEWSTRNRAAFLAGYTEGGGHIGGDDAVLLRALELSKAVYEVVYESRNRPAWLPIPLAAFTGGGPA
ncbi:maltokinase N-terminal cap-like domain-containing protein [Sphaerimonospora mesophila]|uniref:maltokinase N-terminal cap-like domain-containing protein n=1 Tax=Sphaerimonospora mesophila TaxID=37483 RepID=UPI0006E231FD